MAAKEDNAPMPAAPIISHTRHTLASPPSQEDGEAPVFLRHADARQSSTSTTTVVFPDSTAAATGKAKAGASSSSSLDTLDESQVGILFYCGNLAVLCVCVCVCVRAC